MISTTNIVNSFPCVRKSLFSDTFRNTNADFSYPLVIGNIIHDSFEIIIQEMNFDEARLEEVFRKAIEHNVCYLYQLKQTEEKALTDCKLAAKNIRLWVANMFDSTKNSYGITYDRTIATEQEFNSSTYGIKGKLDATIVLKSQSQPDV